MSYKNKNTLAVILLILLLIINIASSYAYFTANLTGEETTSITVTGGKMNIIYSSGKDINISNVIPNNDAIETKTFTVTGNNTTDIVMAYEVSLIVEKNTFPDDALKYKLTSVNTGSNGNVIPNTDFVDIKTGSATVIIGNGDFEVPTGGNKVHTYELAIYFPNASYNQNLDQDKELKARIGIDNYLPPCSLGNCLKDLIVAQEGGTTLIEGKTNPDYNVINTANGLFAAFDEYGTSYYYRGERELLLNNLIFANHQWKIVRVNGDGSIRIIYNGTEENYNQNQDMNILGDDTFTSISPWTANVYEDNKYVGYMHGTVTPSTSRLEAVANINSATIKNQLDLWYQNNILGKFDDYLADNLFCNNRELSSEVGGEPTGLGYGDDITYYAAYHNMEIVKNPSLKCKFLNDRFTVSDGLGNTSLTYPVGLITADEASMAGLVWNLTNTGNFLYTERSFWTLSPYRTDWYSEMVIISDSGHLSSLNVDYSDGGSIRPVLNLKFDTKVTGSGSKSDPYRVE